jgi:hypothetical protein
MNLYIKDHLTKNQEVNILLFFHSDFLEAILWAKKEGFKIFGFGGYGHYAKKNDQIFHINSFKRNFTVNYTFYPKRMIFTMRSIKSLFLKIVTKEF